MNLADIQILIENEAIEFIRFEQSDLHGIARSKTIPSRHFLNAAQKGLNFPLSPLGQDIQGYAAKNTGYIEELGFTDSLLIPDLETFQILPWSDKTAHVLCLPYFKDGRAAMAASRQVLQPLLKELEQMGYRLLSSFEYEFFLVDAQTRQPGSSDILNFAPLGVKFEEVFVYKLLRYLSEVGIDINGANSEHGPGQIEINYAPAWGINAADIAFIFKNGVKEIAHKSGLIASFMTKPWIQHSANGCHYNQSLWQDEKNAFFDPKKIDGISATCRHYIAGQLVHAPALSALAAPTINCWKRFQPFSLAPTNGTWGIDNRTAAIRLKATGDNRMYLENRCGCGAVNPYLLMAGCLAAGIDGIKRQLEPPDPIEGIGYDSRNAHPLPQRLETALDALLKDTILGDLLGQEFIKLYVAVKRHEIEKAQSFIVDYNDPTFLQRVDEWELQEFFTSL